MIDNIVKIISNPILIGLVMLALGFLVGRKKIKAYLKILYLLTEAVEIIDKEIKDILPPAMEEKLLKIKTWIGSRISKQEKEILDAVLKVQGFLQKSQTNG